MSIRRFLAPFVCAVFGLSCVIWSIVAGSSPVNLRGAAAFIGVLFLLLATVYVRIILPQESAMNHQSGERNVS